MIIAGANAGLKVKYYSIYAGIPNAMNQMGKKVSTFTPIIQVTESHENDPDHPQWLKDIEAEYFEFSRKSPYADRIRMLIEMFAEALDKAGTDNPTEVGFALEGLTSRGAKGEIYMLSLIHI